MPGTSRATPPLVIYFGGNAEEVSWMLDDARDARARRRLAAGRLPRLRRSEGSPSEKRSSRTRCTGTTMLSRTLERDQVIAFGRSLGSGVAVQLAAAAPGRRRDPGRAVRQPGRGRQAPLPVSCRSNWMLKHRFDSVALAPQDENAAAVHRRRARRDHPGRSTPGACTRPGAGRSNGSPRGRRAQQHRRRARTIWPSIASIPELKEPASMR